MSVESISRRLDRLPVSRFHYRLVGLIAGGIFFDGFDVYLAGAVLGALVKSGVSDLHQNALFISATFAGMAIGAFLAGYLGDKFGRRFSYQANLAIFGIASIAGALAPSMSWLIGFRFFMGIGLGAEIVLGFAMLSEFLPPAVRGKWAAALAFVANSSLLAATLLGYLIIPVLGWRWMFAIAGVGALYMLYLRKAMPESPRWLASKGRIEEAREIVTEIEIECGAQQQDEEPEAGASIEAAAPTRVLSKTEVGRRLLVASVINIVTGLALYGFVSWIPTFLVKQGFNIAASLGYTTLMSIGGPLGAVLSHFLADRIGRKAGLVVSSLGIIGFGWFYCDASTAPVLVGAGFGLVTSIYFLLSIGSATYVPELFETVYRMRAVGTASTFGRVASMISPFVIVAAFETWGILGIYTVLSIGLVIMCVLVMLLGIETRGRSLEAIGRPQNTSAHGANDEHVFENRGSSPLNEGNKL